MGARAGGRADGFAELPGRARSAHAGPAPCRRGRRAYGARPARQCAGRRGGGSARRQPGRGAPGAGARAPRERRRGLGGSRPRCRSHRRGAGRLLPAIPRRGTADGRVARTGRARRRAGRTDARRAPAGRGTETVGLRTRWTCSPRRSQRARARGAAPAGDRLDRTGDCPAAVHVDQHVPDPHAAHLHQAECDDPQGCCPTRRGAGAPLGRSVPGSNHIPSHIVMRCAITNPVSSVLVVPGTPGNQGARSPGMNVTSSSLTKAAGAAGAVAGAIFIAVQINHPATDTFTTETSQWVARESAKIVMAGLALAGITGMYLSQYRKAGLLGLVGYLVFAAGYPGMFSVQVIAAAVLPNLVDTQPGFVNDVLAAAAGGTPNGDIGGLQTLFNLTGAGYI